MHTFPRLEHSSPGGSERTERDREREMTESGRREMDTTERETPPESLRSVFEHDDPPDPDPPDPFTHPGDEMPIELISLTDRFVESLSAKVHAHPPAIDALSALFQDFYATAADRIATHISALSTRQRRVSGEPGVSVSSRSPAARSPVASSRSSVASVSSRSPVTSAATRPDSAPQQMLTTSEISDKRRARHLLEKKRLVLEEAVERRACEAVYDRIWRHRSTSDAELDEKLRSKTAALAVVGIGLRDLGIAPAIVGQDADAETRGLELARAELALLNDQHHPRGKLAHLKSVYTHIVDWLSAPDASDPSTPSSADEILPTLIYLLISTPAHSVNAISNLLFIQRFRNTAKIDGETAYCLTNLEAAVAFLQTVDLSTLRDGEGVTGGYRVDSTTDESNPPNPSTSAPSDPPAAPPPRRLFPLPFTAADVGGTLESSYAFLVGRLTEQRGGGRQAIVVPKTLDDARRLIGTDELTPAVPAGGGAGGGAAVAGGACAGTANASGANAGGASAGAVSAASASASTNLGGGTTTGGAGTVRSLSSLNPLNRLAGMSVMRGFRGATGATGATGRTTGSGAAGSGGGSQGGGATGSGSGATTSQGAGGGATGGQTPPGGTTVGGATGDARTPPETSPAVIPPVIPPVIPGATPVSPPLPRFMELDNPADLRISEVLDLLKDYRRLATALTDRDAFR